ncbi:MAG: preprotein translocase subunit SecG [Acutalibacteraceae bacterium]|nr:preprotein translocase subunit SecG [Acutalibacteraceae bacterium]
MTGLQIALSIVLIIVAVAIIILVIAQESKQKGLSGTIGGAADTFFGKNKGRTNEAKLAMLTKIAGTIFFVLSFVSALLILFGA